MRLARDRRRRIERIESRIARLRDRAAALLESEQRAQERVSELRASERGPAGRLRAARRGRALAGARRRAQRLREERAQLVQGELRAIMLLLKDQSSRTRERLDRALERIAPLEQEWEHLRGMFASLEETLSEPALGELAGQWRGELAIPDFPVVEHQGYIKPFPPRAILF